MNATVKGEADCGAKPSEALPSGLPQPSSQPPKCPECGSESVWKNGLRYLADGSAVQRWLCKLCGYRFSKPNVEVDVGGQFREGFETVKELPHAGIAAGNLPFKKSLDEASFKWCEDAGIHNGTVLAKTVNSFRDRIRDCRVLRLREGAKNSAPIKGGRWRMRRALKRGLREPQKQTKDKQISEGNSLNSHGG